jgi:hypothetical protein
MTITITKANDPIQMRAFSCNDNLVGLRFDRLVVVDNAPSVQGRARWRVRCDCGKEKIVLGHNLKGGRTGSCGCRYHRLTGTSTHKTWEAMKYRCFVATSKDYSKYGARGIDMDPRWKEFLVFLKDMGPRPKGMTIGRIDNDRGYWKDNCRWETPTQQANNRRSTHFITLFGITKPIKQWATELKMSHQALWYRLKAGLTDVQIITIPLNHNNKFKERTA